MEHYLRQLHITNFKSLKDLALSDCRRINMFIGYPNTGKSAIIEAIGLLGYMQEYCKDYIGKFLRMKSANELFHNGDVRKQIEISANSHFSVKVGYSSEKNLDLGVYTDISFDETQLRKHIIFEHDSAQLDMEYPYNRVQLIKSHPDFCTVKKYTFSSSYNKEKTSGLVLDFPAGGNLPDIVYSNTEIRKIVAELLKSSDLNLTLDTSNNELKGIRFIDDGVIYTIPFYQMADTLQRLVFNIAAIKSNSNSVLLFEEPEAHMFPPYIQLFNNEVVGDTNGNQFFIATHSPYVVNELIERCKLEEISLFAVGQKNGRTFVNRLTDEELKQVYEDGIDLFFNLEEYLKDV